jgi:hypothetical protein
MMDWSVNWDAVANCASRYEYANSFNSIFRPSQTLNLTSLLEGFYDPVTNLMRQDTLRAYLRDTLSPFTIIDSALAMMSSSGSASMKFTKAVNSRKYLLMLKHRNSIETWSRSAGITFSSSQASFNFTPAAAQAFGSNLKQVDNSPVRYAVYGGDVNQDGTVDGADLNIIDNDSFNFVTGYVRSDVNGDNVADASDASLCDNNAFNFVQKIVP